MKFDFTYFLLRVLRYYCYYCVFPGFSRIQLTNKICGGNCSVEIRSSSWSAKVCLFNGPGLLTPRVFQVMSVPCSSTSGSVEIKRITYPSQDRWYKDVLVTVRGW
jgi:hypothetical protein